jgi:transcriptional regulator with XRE-family HTH domain
MITPMSVRERARDRAKADARMLGAAAARELRLARRRLGWSQEEAGRAAGMSHAQWGRLERDDLASPTLDQLCRAGRAVGLDPAFRYYASETQPNDRGQLPVLSRFETVLGPGLRMAREVGLAVRGDQRAWDARVHGAARHISLDCEARLEDIQAVARRVALKQRDDPGCGPVILLVGRSRYNRQVLATHREALREQFPLDGAEILRGLRAGRIPHASGILML